jgi:C-terminal processing protease CtpA/Prc
MQYATLQPLCLNLNRVFVLTTRATVSAAELVINNLKPFITVIQVGETTAGKDEASFLIEDYRVPKQVTWKMQPTIYKLFNKNNQGNYAAGILPQYQVEELANLPLTGIGDMDDPLLHKALELIYGNDLPGSFTNLRAPQSFIPVKVRHHSAAEQATCIPFIIENP